MLTRKRKILLFATLAGMVGLAVFALAPYEPGRSQTAASVSSSKSAGPSAPTRVTEKDNRRVEIGSEFPQRGSLGDPKVDLFGPQSWQPPPPAVVAAPPPPPTPPSMTYRFAGRLLQDGKLQVFVSQGDTPVAVKPGDRLDGGYVVESITAAAIHLIYPPLQHKVNIAIPPEFSAQGSAQAANAPAPPLPAALGALPMPPARGDGVALIAAPKPNSGAARVQWDGPAQVKVGANFSVALRVATDQPISGSPMQVRFDPAILESVSVRPGKLYAAEAGRGFNYRMNPEDGSIFIGATTSSASAAGNAELLVLTFKPIKPGAWAEVSLTNLSLQGAAGRLVAHDTLSAFRASVTR